MRKPNKKCDAGEDAPKSKLFQPLIRGNSKAKEARAKKTQNQIEPLRGKPRRPERRADSRVHAVDQTGFRAEALRHSRERGAAKDERSRARRDGRAQQGGPVRRRPRLPGG